MVEKVGHIKNPLTVIAIFAGLAEVSGTVVLPFLQADTQQIYIWFLMGFPCLLVLLFFLTLLLKHYVLYAPSDFRDDTVFADLFTRGTGFVRVQKLQAELAAEAVADVPSDSEGAGSISAREIVMRDTRGIALLAEEFALAKLSKDLGVQFDRGVALKGKPYVMFDAVAAGPEKPLVVEVKYTSHGLIILDQLRKPFERVQTFVSELPDNLRSNFQFIFALVADRKAVPRAAHLRSAVEKIASDYAFSTRVAVYVFSELEEEFQIK